MQVGFVCCDGIKRPYAECIQHAGEHQCQWTAALLTAMAGNVREQKDHLTITELLGCPRATVWKKTRDYYESPESAYAKWRGSLFHHLLDGVNSGALVEQRFFKTLPNGILISGQPDLVYPEQSLLLDYKTTKYLPKEPYATHALQLNAYRWLLWPRYKVFNLEVVYMDMTAVRRLPVALEELEHIEQFLAIMAQVITGGLDGQLPERMDENGRWQCNYCPFTADCWPEGVPRNVRAGAKG